MIEHESRYDPLGTKMKKVIGKGAKPIKQFQSQKIKVIVGKSPMGWQTIFESIRKNESCQCIELRYGLRFVTAYSIH